MKISIVTPVYNSEKTIETTILSVINQTLNSELEYIIIDGGSTDKTLEIINLYSKRINIIISEKDKGTYDAMNKGIALATGDIIGIINSDDWYNNGALTNVEQAFTQNPHISIVYSPVKNYFNDNYVSTFQPGNIDNLIFKNTLAHPSCFVRKSVYEQVGIFDLSYPIVADYDFLFRAYTSGAKFHYVDTPLASFALNGISCQLKNRLKMIRENQRVAAEFVAKHQGDLAAKHRQFYRNWFLRELLILPLKYFDPVIVIKVKGYIRSKMGILSSDKYGAW